MSKWVLSPISLRVPLRGQNRNKIQNKQKGKKNSAASEQERVKLRSQKLREFFRRY